MTDSAIDQIVHVGVMIADLEALTPNPPKSRLRTPDGTEQNETGAEYIARVVGTTIRQLIDVGLLEVAADAERRIRDEGIPLTPTWAKR